VAGNPSLVCATNAGVQASHSSSLEGFAFEKRTPLLSCLQRTWFQTATDVPFRLQAVPKMKQDPRKPRIKQEKKSLLADLDSVFVMPSESASQVVDLGKIKQPAN